MPRMSPTTEVAVTPAQTSAIVAAAISQNSTPGGRVKPRRESWTARAWDHYDNCGELRYAVSWFSNALSRSELIVTKRNADGDYDPVTEGPAFDALQELTGVGQSELLKAMGQQYFVPGDFYLVGRTVKGRQMWEVVSTEEMKVQGDGSSAQWKISRSGEKDIELSGQDTVIRIWTPHPRNKMKADSPTRGAHGVLNQIIALTRHIDAQVYSRLAGAGILWMPNEVSFAARQENGTIQTGNGDAFLETLAGVMAEAMKDPGAVEALVPIIARVPAETIEHIKHMTFWSELDQQAVPQLESALRRMALTIDLPPEVVLGTADMNHWGAWQVDESSIKAHIEPALGVICSRLTVEWLRPQLDEADADDYLVAFDTSKLRLRPNRSKEAVELWDRGGINLKALRRETGFEESDAMEPEELVRWLLLKMAMGSATPEMVAWAARELGADMPDGLGDQMREKRPDPSLVEHPEQGPPERTDSPNEVAALTATCEAVVYRALERAGNRLNNGSKARPPDIDPSETHLYLKAGNAQLGTLLDGAWSHLDRLMEGSPYHPDIIERILDSYCRMLLSEQKPYDRGEMLRYLRSGMAMR